MAYDVGVLAVFIFIVVGLEDLLDVGVYFCFIVLWRYFRHYLLIMFWRVLYSAL